MLREKICSYCNQIFYHEDGIDERSEKMDVIFREAFCPRCDDPNTIPGLTFKKEDIYNLFVDYLKEQEIDIEGIDKDSILAMMKEFPRCYALYHSNSTYRTVTLYPGERFMGMCGEFELGDYIPCYHQEDGSYTVKREIKCLRCSRVTGYARTLALGFYLGVKEKRCKDCDKWERDLSGLKPKARYSEFSDRAMAKALNVSRMDYRRNKPTKPVPALSIGTVVGSYKILSVYWDENPSSYSPKYLIECIKCGQQSRILQKRINDCVHFCSALGKVTK